jgi:hypothetical protein
LPSLNMDEVSWIKKESSHATILAGRGLLF